MDSVVIERIEDANEGWREGRNGRIYFSRGRRILWLARQGIEVLDSFDRLKDAKQKYPNAKILRSQ